MKQTLVLLARIGAVVVTLFAGQVAQALETARDYCENNQGYVMGSREYTRCYTNYIWAHCDGQGNKPGTPGHVACMKALMNG